MSRERPRLLQLVHGYPPAVGGVERSTRDLCEALVAHHGFDVDVLTTDAYTISAFTDRRQPTIPITGDETQNGVRITRCHATTRWSGLLRQTQRLAWRLRLPGNDRLRTWYNGPRSAAMREAAGRIDADVVCAASFPLNHMRYPFMRPSPGLPVVLIGAVHTNDPWGFDRPYLLRLTRSAFATVAHTEHERDWLVARGAPSDRVRVIGHGIDPDELHPAAGAFRGAHGIDPGGYVIAYVGQLAHHKGLDVLVATFPALLRRRPDAWLVIGGSRTPFTDDLEAAIADLPDDARARVRLVTDLDEQQKADLLGDCDAFASPSKAESFGITTLEAWALRKPVVVGDAPSQRCIVEDGVNGFLVPYGDEAALLEALDRLGDAPTRTTLGNAGYERLLDRYRRADVESAYAALLHEAVEQGGRLAVRSVPSPRVDGMS